MIYLSHSQLSVARGCPRKYYYKYVLGRSPFSTQNDPKIKFGDLWDDLSGLFWKKGEACTQTARDFISKNKDKIAYDDQAKLLALSARYSPPFKKFDFLDNQHHYEIQIHDPSTGKNMPNYRLHGYTDTRLRENDILIIRECKTTAEDIEGHSAYWQRLSIDSQVAWYYLMSGCRVLYYDVVKRPTLKMCSKDKKAAALHFGIDDPSEKQTSEAYRLRLIEDIDNNRDKYFQWRPIYLSNNDKKEAALDLIQQAKYVRTMLNTEAFFRNSSSCKSHYGQCPYLDVCTGVVDIQSEGAFYDR
jgi:hypothetical protein